MENRDLLIEIGTEELPPKALKKLSDAFTQGIVDGLKAAQLNFGQVDSYASPRRLAILIHELDVAQPDRNVEKKGPAVKAAFDADGNPKLIKEHNVVDLRCWNKQMEHLQKPSML